MLGLQRVCLWSVSQPYLAIGLRSLVIAFSLLSSTSDYRGHLVLSAACSKRITYLPFHPPCVLRLLCVLSGLGLSSLSRAPFRFVRLHFMILSCSSVLLAVHIFSLVFAIECTLVLVTTLVRLCPLGKFPINCPALVVARLNLQPDFIRAAVRV
jgi:hypothetical protein